MAGNVNKVILVGNLGADPVVRNFPAGGRVCEFRLATTENWKDRTSGERKERTQWHNVSIYNDGLIGVVEQYLRKGSSVYVEGQLEYRVYQDNAGQDRYWTEVALRSFRSKLVLIDRRDGGPRGDDHGYGAQRSDDLVTSDPGPAGSGYDLDNEIPF